MFARNCAFNGSHSTIFEMVTHCGFDLYSPRDIEYVEYSSCTSWPFVCPLYIIVYADSLFNLKSDSLFIIEFLRWG